MSKKAGVWENQTIHKYLCKKGLRNDGGNKNDDMQKM